MERTKVTRDKEGNLKNIAFTEKEGRNALVIYIDKKTKRPSIFWTVQPEDAPAFAATLEFLMKEFKNRIFQDIHDGTKYHDEEESAPKRDGNLRYIG